MNVDGDDIKIFPKRKAAYNSNGNVAVAFLHYKSIGPLFHHPTTSYWNLKVMMKLKRMEESSLQ